MAQTTRLASFGPVILAATFHLLPVAHFVDNNLYLLEILVST